MADTTTELEVLNEIVDVLDGTSGQYETVVPVLQQIKELLASGITDPEAIAEAAAAWLDEHPEATTTVQDGSVTDAKLADGAATTAKLADGAVTFPKLAQDVKGEFANISDSINVIASELYDEVELVPYQTANGWEVLANGLCRSSENYQIVKYAVTQGEILMVDLADDGDGVYQWQSQAGVPSSGPTFVIGSTVTTATKGLIVAPEGAYYLITCKLITNVTNSVARLLGNIDYEGYKETMCSKNLIGNEEGVLYPVKTLHAGDVLTFSTSDGEPVVNNILVNFYDADKTYLDYYAFGPNIAVRTVTLPESLEGTAYLSVVQPDPSRPIQVQLGGSVLPYEPYVGNVKLLAESIDDIGTDVSPQTMSDRTFNSAYHTGATNFRTKCQQFSALMYGDTVADVEAPTDCESFLFFTDPHTLQGTGWESRCQELIAQIQKYYNSTPTTFCLCGGDWLGNADLPDDACFKLGYIDGFMHSMFDNCHMLVGNHDTNYQGKLTEESELYTTRLSNQSIRNLWYRGGKAYYEFSGANTRFFCFDTGTEGQPLASYGGYGYEQVQWFAGKLLANTAEHVALAMHMLRSTWASGVTAPLPQAVLDVAKAFNDRTTTTVNGTTYDFTNASGKVEFLIAGHYHDDANIVINGIPCIVTADVKHNLSVGPTFDLVLADYGAGVVKLIRVGDGSDRTISLS